MVIKNKNSVMYLHITNKDQTGEAESVGRLIRDNARCDDGYPQQQRLICDPIISGRRKMSMIIAYILYNSDLSNNRYSCQ